MNARVHEKEKYLFCFKNHLMRLQFPVGCTCRTDKIKTSIYGFNMLLRSVIAVEAMFTLYRIGFCSISKLALVQCEQELMFCSGAEIVPKRSQCEHKPYPSYNLQRSLLISKDHLPVRGSIAISPR